MLIIEGQIVASFKSKKGNNIVQLMVETSRGFRVVNILAKDGNYKIGDKVKFKVELPFSVQYLNEV